MHCLIKRIKLVKNSIVNIPKINSGKNKFKINQHGLLYATTTLTNLFTQYKMLKPIMYYNSHDLFSEC